MALSCTLFPKVRDRDGNLKESRLFREMNDMLSPDRAMAVRLWNATRSKNFREKYGGKMSVDENGEPTMASLMKDAGLSRLITAARMTDRLNKRYRFADKDGSPVVRPDTYAERHELAKRAVAFNEDTEYSDCCVATVDKTMDKDGRAGISAVIGPRTDERLRRAAQMEYNEDLNRRLAEILKDNGVAVGVLNEHEESLGINGVTDFETAKVTAEGLIEAIRLAHGLEGKVAFPEEFAHTMLRILHDNPLVGRLSNIITDNSLATEILGDEYEKYDRAYQGDSSKLAEEAMGKLVARHLFMGESIRQSEPHATLLQRLINNIKAFLRKLSADRIASAMNDAELGAGNLARYMLNGNVKSGGGIESINREGRLFSLAGRVQTTADLLKDDIIANEMKRLSIIQKRANTDKLSAKQRALVGALQDSLDRHTEIEGVYLYMANAIKTLDSLDKRLVKLSETEGLTLSEKADTLRNIRDYLFSYWKVQKRVRDVMLDQKRRNGEWYQGDNYGSKIESIIYSMDGLMNDLYSNWHNEAYPLAFEFFRQFMPEDLTIPFGGRKGGKVELDSLLRTADHDISIMDRWLDAMANSSDMMLRLFDQGLKKSKFYGRLRTLDMQKEIKAAGRRLEQAGVRDFGWMFETDDDGKLTGNFIDRIHWGKYKKAEAEKRAEIASKYGDNPVGLDRERAAREMGDWYAANREVVNKEVRPKMSIYGNPAFDRMSQAQREFYDAIMEKKKSLDGMLPEYATWLFNAPKIRKDLVERIKSSSDAAGGARQLWEAIKDAWLIRSDDTDFREKATLMDFEGRQVHTLPIYFTKMHEGESVEDMSTDVVSIMSAYAAMAIDYDEMSKIIDVMEVARDLMSEREVVQSENGRTLVERMGDTAGRITRKLVGQGSASYMMSRLNSFFEMQVYGRYMKEESVFGTRWSWGKTANNLNALMALNTYAFNLLSGISNVETGKVMMRIESFSREFFSETDTLTADKEYAKAMMDYLAETGTRTRTSKLALWLELFNVMQDYESVVRSTKWERRTKVGQLFEQDTQFFMNNCGEHWMQSRTSLALANRFKMKAPDGTICSLWDAMEVEFVNPDNPLEGARLKVKDGYTKEDGTEFTADDIFAFERRCAHINQKMHGIYNKLDMSAAQQYGLGRMAFMYRKWMLPAYERRLSAVQYNFDLDAWTEGYYRTAFRFLNQMRKDIGDSQYTLASRWDELTDTERANILRAGTECAHLVVITLASMLTTNAIGDDRKNSPWYLRMIEYQLRRLRTEIGVLVPTPMMLNEMLTLVRTPAAAISYLDTVLGLVNCLNPWNYEFIGGDDAVVQSDKYKGKSKAERAFIKALPYWNTVYRSTHPEEAVQYYNNWNN